MAIAKDKRKQRKKEPVGTTEVMPIFHNPDDKQKSKTTKDKEATMAKDPGRVKNMDAEHLRKLEYPVWRRGKNAEKRIPDSEGGGKNGWRKRRGIKSWYESYRTEKQYSDAARERKAKEDKGKRGGGARGNPDPKPRGTSSSHKVGSGNKPGPKPGAKPGNRPGPKPGSAPKTGGGVRPNPDKAGDVIGSLFAFAVGYYIIRFVADLATTLTLNLWKKRPPEYEDTVRIVRFIRIGARVLFLAITFKWAHSTKTRYVKEAWYGAGMGAVVGTVEDISRMVLGDAQTDSARIIRSITRSDQDLREEDRVLIAEGYTSSGIRSGQFGGAQLSRKYRPTQLSRRIRETADQGLHKLSRLPGSRALTMQEPAERTRLHEIIRR